MPSARVDWLSVLNHENLSQAGAGASSLREMAERLSVILDADVTVDSLGNAYRRHARALGLPASVTEYFDGSCNPPLLSDVRWPLSRTRRKAVRAAKRWVITAAVNETPVNPAAWAALTRYARKHKAEILVIPLRYVNPTTRSEDRAYEFTYRWADEVCPYLCDEAVELHPRFTYAGHIRVQATAVNPLTGLDALTRSANGVVGHPQLMMKTVPTPQNDSAKVMTTSMAVTEPIYSTTKQGVRAEFHHSTGALVVETDRRGHYIRHLICDDEGGFYDIAGGELRYYHAAGDRKAQAEYLAVSDEHVPFTEPQNVAATYTDSDSITAVCKPQYIIRHDTVDMFAINPHERKDVVKRIAGAQFGFNDLTREMETGAEYILRTTPPGVLNVFPWSNHPNEHLLRWLKTPNVIFDEPWNAKVWLRLMTEIVNSLEECPGGYKHSDPFAVWMGHLVNRHGTVAKFLDADESFVVAGVELGNHGHLGPNGARGSRVNMSRIGIRTVIGHGHSPGIMQGCWQLGTMSRDLKYARGPSGWACWQVVGFPNGKRQGYFVNEDGRWYAQ